MNHKKPNQIHYLTCSYCENCREHEDRELRIKNAISNFRAKPWWIAEKPMREIEQPGIIRCGDLVPPSNAIDIKLSGLMKEYYLHHAGGEIVRLICDNLLRILDEVEDD